MFHVLPFRLVFLLLFISISLTACQDKKQAPENTEETNTETQTTTQQVKIAPLRDVVSAGDANIVMPAFLGENLPESTFAYVRIPNIWSFIGTKKGNVFDKAVNAQPFVDAVKSIRAGVSENIIPEIPDADGQLLATLLLNKITSPIESIAIEGVDPAIPTPNLLITANVDFTSVDEIQQYLELLTKHGQKIEITKAMQADGYAELNIAKMSAQLHWNKEQSRLTLLLGVSLSPNNLTDVIKILVPNPTHQMKAIESTIDTSGQGLFAWANPRKLSSMGNALGMQRELAGLAVMGVSSMKNIAIGSGTSGGINRLKYVVEMPVTGFRAYMPIIKASPNFDVMGDTKMVGVLGLPSRTDFVSIENTAALVTKARDMESYYTFKKEFRKMLGFEIEDIFDFFGQDISFVSDDAGSYVAIRLNDAKKFKTTLAKSVETLNLEYKQREIGGHTYHHLKIPSLYSKYLDEKSQKKSRPEDKLVKRFLSLPSHVYWEQEGDYLIMSNIPQTLIDRHYIKTKTSVNEWLVKQQRMNPDGSLMMFSLRNQGTAEKMYRMHLGAINTLADLSGKPIDLFALASPHEADIPKESSYGFKISSTETQLAFELNYESNPFEFLLAGSAYEGLAVLGILSAIAVPAYDDYTVRAELMKGVAATSKVKVELNEFEIEYGRYPNQYEIDDLKLNSENSNFSITVTENSGVINLKFKNKKVLRNRNSVKMLPPKQGVSTTWRCQSRINRKYLPKSAGCR